MALQSKQGWTRLRGSRWTQLQQINTQEVQTLLHKTQLDPPAEEAAQLSTVSRVVTQITHLSMNAAACNCLQTENYGPIMGENASWLFKTTDSTGVHEAFHTNKHGYLSSLW